MNGRGSALLYLILLLFLFAIVGASYLFLQVHTAKNKNVANLVALPSESKNPSIIPTSSSNSVVNDANQPTDFQYKDIKTYGVEITEEQHTKLVSYAGVNKMTSGKSPSYYLGKGTGWYYMDGPFQNQELFVKGNYLCESVYLWCGGLNMNDPQAVKDERNQCQSYNINLNNTSDWMQSNTGQCCRQLSTGKPYVLSCADTSRDPNKPINDDLLFTYTLLKGSGADCNNYNCLPAIETQIEYY